MIRRQPRLSTLILLLCVLALSACSGAASVLPSPTPSAPALSETTTDSKQAFSLGYPKGWAVDTSKSNNIMLANDNDTLQLVQQMSSNVPTIKAGQIAIAVQLISTSPTPLGVKHGDVVAFMKKLMEGASAQTGVTYTDPRAVKIGDIDAAQREVTATTAQAVAYTFWVDSPIKKQVPYAAFLFTAVVAPGELAKQQPFIEAVLQSVKFLK